MIVEGNRTQRMLDSTHVKLVSIVKKNQDTNIKLSRRIGSGARTCYGEQSPYFFIVIVNNYRLWAAAARQRCHGHQNRRWRWIPTADRQQVRDVTSRIIGTSWRHIWHNLPVPSSSIGSNKSGLTANSIIIIINIKQNSTN